MKLTHSFLWTRKTRLACKESSFTSLFVKIGFLYFS